MATRRFADLSSYRRAVDNAQGTANLLDSVLGGIQQGIQLQRLPQTLQQQDLANQLQAAINQQKLIDLQNPQAALIREAQKAAIKEQITDPFSGIGQAPVNLIGETIGVPSAIPQTATELEQAIAGGMAIPTAAPRLPITPIGTGADQTGFNIDPNIPLAAEARKTDEMIRRLQATPVRSTLTKEGYAWNPVTRQLEAPLLPEGESLATTRKTDAEASAEAKIAGQERLLGRKLEADEAKQIRDQEFRAIESEKDRANRLTLADKRQKLADPIQVQANLQKQSAEFADTLSSIDDLDKDISLATVGFADWVKGIPTTPAKSFAARLETLKAKIGLGELQAMKSASKTGGSGLGAVSNFELRALQGAKGALDQALGPEDFRAQLKRVRDSFEKIQELTRAIDAQYGATAPATTATPTVTAPVRVNNKAERDALPPGTVYISPSGAISTR